MKKFKIGLIIVILAVFGLFVLQNLQFLLEKKSITLNLFFVRAYSTPELPMGVILLISFLAGFLIAYIVALFERFSLKNIIKALNYTIESNIEKIAELKNEVSSIKKEVSSVQKEQKQ